jgi:hypothetical protein
MPNFICRTCGVEYAESNSPPDVCIICEDERQYVGWGGQKWTTLGEMKAAGYKNEIREEAGITGICTTPGFAIGQRALIIPTSEGNVLYDCITLLDDETIEAVRALGGIQAMCVSHPHFYDTMVTWSHTFENAPIYIPEADKQWVTRPDPVIRYWDGKPLEPLPGATLIQCGGHFEGSAVLHWADGADGKGAICVGDTLSVVLDRRYVSFMNSYPNLIPLSANEVKGIVNALEPYEYDRIYGGWWGRNVMTDAKTAVRNSAERYIRRIQG